MNLKRLIKASVTGCAICSLTACCTIEIAHAQLDCLGQSEARLNLTDEEIDLITDDMSDKIILFDKSLRERLNSQCTLIKKHNEIHR